MPLRAIFYSLLLCFSTTFSWAQSSVGKVVSTHQVNGTLLIRGSQGQMLLSTLPSATLKVRVDPNRPDPEQYSRSVNARPDRRGNWTVSDGELWLQADKAGWSVIVDKKTALTTYLYQGDTLVQEAKPARHYTDENDLPFAEVAFSTPAEEQFYGAGPRALPHNLRGQRLEVYNQAHYGYANGTPNLNITLPWVISSEGYGLLIDSEMPGIIDLAAANSNQWSYTLERDEELTYYIVAGTIPELPSRYTALTGRQTMPPLWALGFIQSRYGYETEEQARNVVDSMLMAGFPLDGLVLDLQWFGDKQNMGNLDWDRERFPTPEAMMSDFREKGVKTITILEPYFTRQSAEFETVKENDWLAKNEAGEPYIIEDFWTGGGGAGLLDLYKPATHDWFWQFFSDRTKEGVAGWWCDLGEPENHPEGMQHVVGPAREAHNGYSLIWAELLYSRWQREFPEQRLFNLIRSGYTGMQRYGTFPWSGDISRSWSGLQAQIPIMIGSSLSGVAYMSSDLGGFAGGEKNDELYTRWLQYGTFNPIMRAHGSGGIPAEPIYFSQKTQDIVRSYIKLRYRFLPYNYTLAAENALNGTPLVRPVWYHDLTSFDTYTRQDQYLWGKDILVAPVMEPGKTSRDVFLPEGTWIDWWSGKAYAGRQTVNVDAPLEKLPLFVRAGTILPQVSKDMQSTDAYTSTQLDLHVFPATVMAGEMYHDNGQAQAMAKGTYERLAWTGTKMGNAMEIQAQRAYTWVDAPASRMLTWVVHQQTTAPGKVMWGEVTLTQKKGSAALRSGEWRYNASNQTLTISVDWNHTPMALEIE